MNKMKALAVTSATLGTISLMPAPDESKAMAQDAHSFSLNFNGGRHAAPQKNPLVDPGKLKNPPVKNPPSKNPPSKSPPLKNPFPDTSPLKNPQLNVRVAVQSNIRPTRESQYAIKCLQLLAGKITAQGIEKANAQEIRSAQWCLQAFAKGLQ